MMNKIFVSLYAFFMCLVIILPTGNIGHLNIKLLTLLVLIAFVLYDILKNGISIEITNSMKYILCVAVMLLIWLGIGLIKSDSHAFYGFLQYKDFMTTIIVTWMGYYLYRKNLLDWNYYFRMTLFAHLTFIVLKVTAFTLVLFNLITIADVIDFVKNVFGYSLVTFNFSGGIIGGNIVRLDLLNDSLSPFLFLFLLNGDLFGIKINRVSKFIIFILLIINIVIGYKRSLIVISIIALFYTLVFVMDKLTKLKTILIAAAIVTILYINYQDVINYFVADRFNSNSQSYSDSMRSEQLQMLKNEFYDNYMIGKGLGGYANNYIRNEELPYSYEIQWMQFLMQFGVIGILFLILIYCTIIIPVIGNWFCINPKIRTILLLSFILWGSMSFTNPMMLSSFCSAFYTLVLLSALEYSTPNANINRSSFF